jgi:hypothetical protein
MLVAERSLELCGSFFNGRVVVGVLSAYDFDFFELGFEFFGMVYDAEIDVEIGGTFITGFGTEEV